MSEQLPKLIDRADIAPARNALLEESRPLPGEDAEAHEELGS